MRYILTVLLLSSMAFAQYSIKLNGIKLGEIKNLEDSLKKNCLEAEVTNSIARFLLQKDYLIFYNEKYTKKRDNEDTKYKRDKYQIITILQKAYANKMKNERIQIDEGKYIDVKLEDNYKFIYNSKGRIKSDGYFEMKDGKLLKLVETVNDIEISKN